MFGHFQKKNCQQRCGRGRGRGRGREDGGGQGICCAHPLSDFAQDAEVIIISNSDRKTLEMGLFSGAPVTVIKNQPNDANLVIATGESRYIISKEAGKKILVR